MDNITSIILAVMNDLKLFKAAGKLGSLDEIIWRNTGEGLYFELSKNLSVLIDYLKSEYQQGHKIDPQIDCLRDYLQVVETAIHDAVKDKNKRVILEFQALRSKCAEWKEWIDRYYPQAQTTQDVESKTTHENTKRGTAAAARLASRELQEVKSKLIAAGIIIDGVWQGTPAEFGCLVNELFAERRVSDHGRRAWRVCADWVGYQGNIASSRSCIEKHPDTEGPTADLIMTICKMQ